MVCVLQRHCFQYGRHTSVLEQGSPKLGTCDVPWGCGNKYVNRYIVGVSDSFTDVGLRGEERLETNILESSRACFIKRKTKIDLIKVTMSCDN